MTKSWVGWEEDVVLDDKGKHLVCYYLRCAPPRDGDGEAKRDPAVIGKLWGEGNMAYTAHPQFLRSIEEAVALSAAPSRAATVGDEAVELRWKTRREVMDWLTSLVADSPHGASGSAVTSDGCSVGDHDGRSPASKDAGPSTFVGKKPEGFAWLGPLPHLDTWRKRYRSFCRDGMRISVHDFIYIESAAGTESHVAYVEDLYEDGSENRRVLARWLDKPGDDHGFEMPPDVHARELFFSYVLQDIGVNYVEGLAPVLNHQHFEWFQSRAEEHSKWKPYLCHRKIVGTTLTPFDVAQLHGYTKQEIVQALFRAPSSMVVHSTEPNEDKTDGGQKRKHNEISENQLVQNPAAQGNVSTDRAVETNTTLIAVDTLQKLPLCNETSSDQTIAQDAPQNLASNDQTMQRLHPCNATNDQTVQKLPPCNARSDQTVQKLPPCNAANHQTAAKHAPQHVINDLTGKKSVPVSALKTQTVDNKASSNAAHAQALMKLHPSRGSASGSGLLGTSVVKPNVEELFQLGCRVEALSQDSGIRGCWFRGVIVKKKHKGELVKVKYQDIRHAEGKGHLKEWLRLKRTANPDRLGIRLTGRPMIRPSPSNLPKIPSPVTPGTVVDVRLEDGWWEGIVLEPTTVGRVRVYFPGERKVGEHVEKDLRRSFEWVGYKWLSLMPRKDVAARLPPANVVAKQIMPKPDTQKTASLLSIMGAATHANQAAAKTILHRNKGERSAKPVPPIVILESMQVDGLSLEPAAQIAGSQQSSQNAEPVADKVRLQYSQEGDGISVALPDAKHSRVDLKENLKSKNVLKCAERKARGSGPLVGYSDGSSQEGSAAPNGDTEPVNFVPVKEGRKTNEQAPVSTTPPTIDLTDD